MSAGHVLPAPAAADGGSSKRPRQDDEIPVGAQSAALGIVAPVNKAARPLAPLFKPWHYDFRNNAIFRLFYEAWDEHHNKVYWCCLCMEGPYRVGNGGDGNLRAHLNGKKHAKVRGLARRTPVSAWHRTHRAAGVCMGAALPV